MRKAVYGGILLTAACLLGGCASSPGVRQAKLNDPIIVVTVQSTPGKKAEPKPQEPKAELVAKARKEAEEFGILGVLSGQPANGGSLESLFGNGGVGVGGVIGGVPGGVVGGTVGGFGGLGGIGTSGGGGGGGTIGLGGLGTIGRGSEYGMIGLVGKRSDERVKAKLGSITISGPLTLDVVQRQIDEHINDLQQCQDLERSRGGASWGTITLRMRIDATGHVDDVQVTEKNMGYELECCLAHVAGSFAFPPPGANNSETVLLPISF